MRRVVVRVWRERNCGEVSDRIGLMLSYRVGHGVEISYVDVRCERHYFVSGRLQVLRQPFADEA